MVDVIISRDGAAYLAVSDATLDLAYGEDENDYELTLPTGHAHDISQGDIWMIDGTPYGGIIDSIESTLSDGATAITYSGRSLQGVLAHKILQPDIGQDYLTYTGTIGGLIAFIITRCGLSGLYDATVDSTAVSVRFERYTDAYTALRKTLASYSRIPVFRCENDRCVITCAEPKDMTDDAGTWNMKATREYRRTNHLIGLGKGELRDRTVVHWYADADGNISQSQSLTGLDEVADTYDYSNAEADELDAKTKEELESRQEGTGSIDVTVDAARAGLEVGDLLTAYDPVTGLSVRASVSKKVVKLVDGVLSVDYEVGQRQNSSGGSSESSGTSSSGGGGVAYRAGAGIRIESDTISADVTEDDLESVRRTAVEAQSVASDASAEVGGLRESKADREHTHPAATGSTAGFMSAADKTKLDGVEAGATCTLVDDTLSSSSSHPVANRTVADALDSKAGKGEAVSSLSVSGRTLTVRMADGGTSTILTQDTTYTPATQSTAGLMAAADKTKLDGVQEGANRYVLPAATTSTLGGVKPDGRTITVASDGTVSAQQGGSASFLAAHPVGGIYMTTKAGDPGDTYGGSWRELPSLGPYVWERTG